MAGFGLNLKLLLYLQSQCLTESLGFLNPPLSQVEERWEKSPFGTIFPNERWATPTVGKPSLLSHDVLPTVAFDTLRRGVKNSFRNDDKSELSLCTI